MASTDITDTHLARLDGIIDDLAEVKEQLRAANEQLRPAIAKTKAAAAAARNREDGRA